MLKIKKLINIHGDEIFYIATEVGAIEISIRNGCDIYWNFIGLKYDRYSREQVTVKISSEDNENVFSVFDKLFDDVSSLDAKVRSGMLSHSFIGEDTYNVLSEEKIVWQSDDSISSDANSLIIEKNDECYYITFKKSQNMDGYLNRSFRIKIKNVGCRNAPFNVAFMDFYKELLKMEDIDMNDQNDYSLNKRPKSFKYS